MKTYHMSVNHKNHLCFCNEKTALSIEVCTDWVTTIALECPDSRTNPPRKKKNILDPLNQQRHSQVLHFRMLFLSRSATTLIF